MYTLNSFDAILIQNGISSIECGKCGVVDIPHISKSHLDKRDKDNPIQLYKVVCSHCCSYIKFINEHQFRSGVYE